MSDLVTFIITVLQFIVSPIKWIINRFKWKEEEKIIYPQEWDDFGKQKNDEGLTIRGIEQGNLKRRISEGWEQCYEVDKAKRIRYKIVLLNRTQYKDEYFPVIERRIE